MSEERAIARYHQDFRKRFNKDLRDYMKEFTETVGSSNSFISLIRLMELSNECIPRNMRLLHPTILTNCRKRELVILRQLFTWEATNTLQYSRNEVIDELYVDHSTIIHSLKVVKDAKETNSYPLMDTIHNKLLFKIQEEYARILRSNSSEPVNTEPNLPAVLDSFPDNPGADQYSSRVAFLNTCLVESYD